MTIHITANPLETGTDELERLALEECIKRQRVDREVSILVIPAGRCEVAIKFARMGARVTVADQPELQREIEGRILAAGLSDEIRFVPCDFPEFPATAQNTPFDLIISRRGLCHLPYHEAKTAVRQMLHQLKIGGKLYLSILGLHSELSEGYAARDQIINDRFAELSPELADKYNIRGPVSLYTERNLFMLLLEAGGSVLRTLTTTYGNVKGIAVRV
jgi:SAM-dependent methyltransferase